MKKTTLPTFSEKEKIQILLSKVFEIIKIESILKKEIYFSKNTLRFGQKEVSLSTINKIHIVAIGKAAIPMANFFYKLFLFPCDGIIISHIDKTEAKKIIISPSLKYYQSDHPIPTKLSIKAAHSLIDFLSQSKPDELILFCISGGGSALVELPVFTLSLKDISHFYTFLIGSGLSIEQMNSLRAICSQIKGGKLLSFIPKNIDTLSLIISDVEKHPKMFVSSGMTSTAQTYQKYVFQAIDTLKKNNQFEVLSSHIQTILNDFFIHPSSYLCASYLCGLSKQEKKYHKSYVLADAKYLLSKVKEESSRNGFIVSTNSKILKQSSEELAKYYQKKILSYHRVKTSIPKLFIASAEPSVTITSKEIGKGGRNQHLALALLCAMGENPPPFIFVSLATDGKDGNSDFAGAIIDHHTYKLAKEKSIELHSHLQNFSSHEALHQLGHCIYTGPTLSNFMDFHFLYLF